MGNKMMDGRDEATRQSACSDPSKMSRLPLFCRENATFVAECVEV